MLRIKKIIQDKLEEVTNEYNVILLNHSQDLEYINTCTHQYNAMRKVLEEVLEELEKVSEGDNE